jgi:hypothetical protein
VAQGQQIARDRPITEPDHMGAVDAQCVQVRNGVADNPVETDRPLAIGAASVARALRRQDTVSLGQRVDLRSHRLDGTEPAMQEQDWITGSNVLVVTGDSIDLDCWHGVIVRTEVLPTDAGPRCCSLERPWTGPNA